jgi:prevent-host-death family protein
MVQRVRTIGAAEFKAKCLAILEDVAATGVPIVVTKRGRPVARVEPMDAEATGDLRGSVVRERDLLSPVDDAWGAGA